jgi:hypothetical protein
MTEEGGKRKEKRGRRKERRGKRREERATSCTRSGVPVVSS